MHKTITVDSCYAYCNSFEGFYPFYVACEKNHMEVAKYLIDHGANPSLKTKKEFVYVFADIAYHIVHYILVQKMVMLKWLSIWYR